MVLGTKLKKALKKTVKKFLKPILPVVMIGAAFGILAVGIAVTTSLLDWVPTLTVPVVGSTIAQLRVIFLASLLGGALLGGVYVLYNRNRERIHTYWQQLSTWAKAMITGSVSAVCIAIVLSIASALGWVVPIAIGLGVVIIWPVAVGVVLLGYRLGPRAPNTFERVKTAYVLTKGLESRTLSAIIGLLAAIAGSLLLSAVGGWYVGSWPFWATIVSGGLLWILVTVLMYNRYDTAKIERADLTIVGLSTPESQEGYEISVTNTSAQSVDLTESLIRDTDLDLYRPEFEFVVKPGQLATFEINGSFSLEPNDDAIALPLGYELKQGGETPVIFTTDGALHQLQWTAGPAATIDRESSKHTTAEPSTLTDSQQYSPAATRGEPAVDPAAQD